MQLNSILLRKYLDKIEIFWEVTEKYLGNKKFFERRKPITFAEQSF